MRPSNRAFNIRSATAADINRLCELAAEFLDRVHAEASSKAARQVFQQVIRHNQSGIILVAEHKGGICGYAYASYLWRSEFGGETLDIVELFVEHSWRNKGVGATLLATLLENARSRGIRYISAEVHPGNAAIERLLESGGYDPQQRTVWGRHS